MGLCFRTRYGVRAGLNNRETILLSRKEIKNVTDLNRCTADSEKPYDRVAGFIIAASGREPQNQCVQGVKQTSPEHNGGIMSNNDSQPGRTSGLRKKAEEFAREKREQTPEIHAAMSPEETLALFHDLQVHQIELDMQNEELRRSQSELDRLRARYFDLYDLAPVGYCTISEAGLIMESNLTAATLLGAVRSELFHRPLSGFILTEAQDTFYMHRKKLFETGEPQVCVIRMKKKDGASFWARMEAAIAKNEAGEPECRAILSDITASKFQADERELSSHLTSLANTPGDYHDCMVHLAETLKALSGCDAMGIRLGSAHDYPYYATCGFSSEFIEAESRLVAYDSSGHIVLDGSGQPLLECMCGNVLCGRVNPAKPFFTPFGSFWTNSTTVLLSGDDQPGQKLQTRNRCNAEGYESVALIPLRTDLHFWGLLQFNDHHENHFTQGLITHMEKIADSVAVALSRRQVKAALKESEARYAATLSALDDGLWDWHVPSGNIFFSPIYYSILGYDNGEFPPTFDSWRHLVHPDDIERVEEVLRQSLESGKGFTIDLRMKKKTDEWLWVCTRGKTVESSQAGKAQRMVGTLSDITERKLGEEEHARLEANLQQAQKMESIGRLAGGVAHDFNNMLGVILGHSEFALELTSPDQPIHGNLTEIRKAAERSADLTRQLLAFARKQAISPKVIDLNDSVEDILKMLRRLIGESIHLSWQPGPDLWPVKVDPAQIDQILANLCVNAMDAIEDVGKIVIKTFNTTLDEEYCRDHQGFAVGEYICLTVMDNGTGMDPETVGHIFEPFFTTKEVGKGTGLGLATVYGAVKQNNGFIHVISNPGQGSSFEIFLPRNKDLALADRKAFALELPPCGDETILLVEDEPTILKMTKIILEKQGYTVFAMDNPGEALQLAKDHADELHLLITDVIMPEMNGGDLAKAIKPFKPDLKYLFMSGYAANVIAHHGVLDPGVHFIEKPFSNKSLAIKVREVLDM